MKSSERNIDNLHEIYTGTPSHYKAEGKSSIFLDKPSLHLTPKKTSNPTTILSYYLHPFFGVLKISVVQPVRVNAITWSVFTGYSFTMSI